MASPLAGAASAFTAAYGNTNRFMGFKDPEWFRKYKGDNAAAKATKKESQYGAYPQLSRDLGQGSLDLLRLSPEEMREKYKGYGLYKGIEHYLSDPLEEDSTRAKQQALAGYARFGAKNNLGPEFMVAAGQGLDEADRGRIADSRRNVATFVRGAEPQQFMGKMALGEDIFSRRQGQMAQNEQAYAAGMSSYFTALRQEEMLRIQTTNQNRAAMTSAGAGLLSSGFGMMRPTGGGGP